MLQHSAGGMEKVRTTDAHCISDRTSSRGSLTATAHGRDEKRDKKTRKKLKGTNRRICNRIVTVSAVVVRKTQRSEFTVQRALGALLLSASCRVWLMLLHWRFRSWFVAEDSSAVLEL